MNDDDRKLGDRMIDYLRTEVHRMRAEETPDGWRAENYSVAIEVNRIAEALGVSPLAVNGALGHLHRDRRVIGFRIARKKGYPPLYAIALDDRHAHA